MNKTGSISVPLYSTRKNILVGIMIQDNYILIHKKTNKKCRPLIVDNIMIFESEDKKYYSSLFDTTPFEFNSLRDL